MGWLAGWLAGWLGWLSGWILIDFDGFPRIWYYNALHPGTTLRHPERGAVAPIESFTRFQLAAIIDSSIYRTLMVFMDFHDFQDLGSCLRHAKGRPVAPIESFTRFQLAAIIDFHRFL